MAQTLLTHGNAAKLYCLGLIDALAGRRGSLTIVDLGCGDAGSFAALLRKRPEVHYIGVDPSGSAVDAARRMLAGLQAELVHAPAYDVRLGPADAVVSFSVLEHVYRRRRYLESVKENLAPDGRVYINYDAGHFAGGGSPREQRVERWKSRLGRVLARVGREGSYQALVRESEFRSLIDAVGLEIVEDKVFNTDVKRIYRLVPEERRADFMAEWLEFELFLNALGIPYRDELAPIFRTRNFVLRHAGG